MQEDDLLREVETSVNEIEKELEDEIKLERKMEDTIKRIGRVLTQAVGFLRNMKRVPVNSGQYKACVAGFQHKLEEANRLLGELSGEQNSKNAIEIAIRNRILKLYEAFKHVQQSMQK